VAIIDFIDNIENQRK